MKDIRQSPQFARFMEDLGWVSDKIAGSYIYLRKFPITGYFAKIPRPDCLPSKKDFEEIRRKYRIFKMNIAPFITTDDKKYRQYKISLMKSGFSINTSPFNPTTTFLIDLTVNEDSLFNGFTEAKRRAVRRALKNEVAVKESDDINSFIKIRQKQYFPAGFLLKDEMQKIWKNFLPQNGSLLLAYDKDKTPVAGILLLYYDRVAYYWYASALKRGKKLFAPTLLVWEALKLAKKRGCKIFDFEGIYDERFPKASQSWVGFTKFKEGFGGKKVVYTENFTK